MRPTLPVVFGGGLDRDTGVLSVSPEAMQEARNVVLHNGKAESRRGLDFRDPIVVSGYVSLVAAARVAHLGIVVVTDNSGVSRVYSTNGRGEGGVDRGIWHNPSRSDGKTRAIAAESGSFVIMAHDEPNLSDRARSVYYNAYQASTPISPLTAAWAAGAGTDTNIRFRGVVHWLEYLVGWGFGTNETDQPAMVRISEPGQPLVFEAADWVIVGQAGDPVISCQPLAPGLLVYKESETHIITGNQAENFGTFLVEDRYGCAAPRLATVVGDTAYAWSLEGPRRSRGGASEDIGWPLGLPWPRPEDITAMDLIADGFAVYDPHHTQVLFVFGTLVYAFSVRDQKWSHWTLSFPMLSGGIIYARSGYTGPSRGYPDVTSLLETASGTLTVTWDNVNIEGDEALELWLYEYGTNTVAGSATITAFGNGSHDFTGLAGGKTYEVALRYLRDNEYTSATQDEPVILPDGSVADYTGHYSTWPAISRDTEATVAQPTSVAAEWSRTSSTTEQIRLSWTNNSDTKRVLRKLATEADTAYVELVAGLSAATLEYIDTTIAGEVEYEYKVEFGVSTNFSEVIAWSGPPMPLNPFWDKQDPFDPADHYEYTVSWGVAVPGAKTELVDNYYCLTVFWSRIVTGADHTWARAQVERNSVLVDSGGYTYWDFEARVRHRVTAFTVEDFSQYASVMATVQLNSDETAQGSCGTSPGGGGSTSGL